MKYFCYLYLFLLYLSINVLCKKHARGHKHGKIVGGYNTTIQEAAYQAYLLIKESDEYYQCGGSIISEYYILTAAHCLTDAEKVYVRVGSTEADSGGTQVGSKHFEYHPEYDPDTTDYDVGFIELPEALDLDGTNTKAIQIADADTNIEPGTNVLVTGWGTTTEDGEVSPNLMAVQVQTVSNEDCEQALGQITSRMFCAGVPEGGKDSCQGDSGGPAVSTDDNIQLGIVSFGVGCARQGYPGVYTNIASVRDWIKTNTGV